MADDLENTDGLAKGTLNESMGVEDIRVLNPDEWPYIRKTMGPEWDDNLVQFFVVPSVYSPAVEIIAAATDVIHAYLPNPNVHIDDLDRVNRYTRDYLLRKLRRNAVERGMRLVDVDGIEVDGEVFIPRRVAQPTTFLSYKAFGAKLRMLNADNRFWNPHKSTLWGTLYDH